MSGTLTFKVTQKTFDPKKILGRMRKAVKTDVVVGIPRTTAGRDDPEDDANNAAIAYVQEFGSPINHVPARPVLIPGIEHVKDKIVILMKHAAQTALSGGNPDPVLNQIGLMAVSGVRAKFINNDWKPLSPKTLEKVYPDGQTRLEKGRLNPRIDTDQNRKAFTYELRPQGRK